MFSGNREYPFQKIELRDITIGIEGVFYNRTKDQVKGEISKILSAVNENPANNRTALSQSMFAADGEFIVYYIDNATSKIAKSDWRPYLGNRPAVSTDIFLRYFSPPHQVIPDYPLRYFAPPYRVIPDCPMRVDLPTFSPENDVYVVSLFGRFQCLTLEIPDSCSWQPVWSCS